MAKYKNKEKQTYWKCTAWEWAKHITFFSDFNCAKSDTNFMYLITEAL